MTMPSLPPIPNSERLVVVVGASGVGKDSLLRAWRATLDPAEAHFVRRVITRAPDPNEDHEAVTETVFDRLRDGGGLATWWPAHGLRYGVRLEELRALGRGAWAIVNGSRAHLPALRGQAPALRLIEVVASVEVRGARLISRAREDASALHSRLQRRIDAPLEADLTVVNDGALEDGVEALRKGWRRWLDGGAAER